MNKVSDMELLRMADEVNRLQKERDEAFFALVDACEGRKYEGRNVQPVKLALQLLKQRAEVAA